MKKFGKALLKLLALSINGLSIYCVIEEYVEIKAHPEYFIWYDGIVKGWIQFGFISLFLVLFFGLMSVLLYCSIEK